MHRLVRAPVGAIFFDFLVLVRGGSEISNFFGAVLAPAGSAWIPGSNKRINLFQLNLMKKNGFDF